MQNNTSLGGMTRLMKTRDKFDEKSQVYLPCFNGKTSSFKY